MDHCDNINKIVCHLLKNSASAQENESGNMQTSCQMLDKQKAVIREGVKELEEQARLYATEQEERARLYPEMPAFGPPARQTDPFVAIDEVFSNSEMKQLLKSTGEFTPFKVWLPDTFNKGCKAERFLFQDGYTHVLVTSRTRDLLKEFYPKDEFPEKNSHLVEGPGKIGKSHDLYFLACYIIAETRRKEKESGLKKTIVIYVSLRKETTLWYEILFFLLTHYHSRDYTEIFNPLRYLLEIIYGGSPEYFECSIFDTEAENFFEAYEEKEEEYIRLRILGEEGKVLKEAKEKIARLLSSVEQIENKKTREKIIENMEKYGNKRIKKAETMLTDIEKFFEETQNIYKFLDRLYHTGNQPIVIIDQINALYDHAVDGVEETEKREKAKKVDSFLNTFTRKRNTILCSSSNNFIVNMDAFEGIDRYDEYTKDINKISLANAFIRFELDTQLDEKTYENLPEESKMVLFDVIRDAAGMIPYTIKDFIKKTKPVIESLGIGSDEEISEQMNALRDKKDAYLREQRIMFEDSWRDFWKPAVDFSRQEYLTRKRKEYEKAMIQAYFNNIIEETDCYFYDKRYLYRYTEGAKFKYNFIYPCIRRLVYENIINPQSVGNSTEGSLMSMFCLKKDSNEKPNVFFSMSIYGQFSEMVFLHEAKTNKIIPVFERAAGRLKRKTLAIADVFYFDNNEILGYLQKIKETGSDGAYVFIPKSPFYQSFDLVTVEKKKKKEGTWHYNIYFQQITVQTTLGAKINALKKVILKTAIAREEREINNEQKKNTVANWKRALETVFYVPGEKHSVDYYVVFYQVCDQEEREIKDFKCGQGDMISKRETVIGFPKENDVMNYVTIEIGKTREEIEAFVSLDKKQALENPQKREYT
ncbi:MAG: uncharacterized protein A8A55_0551 [Amphiamblys sp. WSBS2006]|nr:MAG: uncharacterized protein A8A55_0551 [Amphiamblys sp. WSBS2006]